MTTDILAKRSAERDAFLVLAKTQGWDTAHAHSDGVTRWLSPMTRDLYLAWLEGRAALALPDASEVACGCGDIYPADSFEAGIMAAKGKCSNCAAALPDEPVERQPLTRKQVQDIVIGVCDVIYPQDGASYSEADSVFYGAFAHAIEKAHNIKGAA